MLGIPIFYCALLTYSCSHILICSNKNVAVKLMNYTFAENLMEKTLHIKQIILGSVTPMLSGKLVKCYKKMVNIVCYIRKIYW